MENDAKPVIEVQLCYARPDLQILQTLQLPEGSTVQQAILHSGILQRVPELAQLAGLDQLAQLDSALVKVGIFNKLKTLETVLREHDRVEIYRPLLIDPKVARRQRVQEKRAAHRK
jgi:putative ubiquitin-RnfH superfamily antitoxin RatB of RatAB toxin-antitoxin module